MEITGAAKIIQQDCVKIAIPQQPTTRIVTVSYHTLNGNNPANNDNYLGIWHSPSGVIPRTKADWSQKITKTEPDSKIICKTPINDNGFVVGYCQTGDPKLDEKAALNVSASAAIIPSGDIHNPDTPLLDIEGDTTSAILKYRLLKNMSYSGHWFGIWEENKTIGEDDPCYTDTTEKADPDKSGIIPLDNVPFYRGSSYTLAYFMAGYDPKSFDLTKMLAFIEFTF